MTLRTITALLLLAAGLNLTAQTRPVAAPRSAAVLPRATPPLVVLIVVDQFRGDYVPWYGHQWTRGLRRLVDTGAYFPLAAYRYAVTLTCAGHSTIGTGAYPRTHGMIANEWFDRDAKKRVTCTDDPSAAPVGFGGLPAKERHGSRMLQTNTFADELRNQSPVAPRITSVSLKARSAIGMAGHAGDLVAWLEDTGAWASSSAFVRQPRPDVDAFANAHAISAQYGRVWNRLLAPSAYLFSDEGVGEQKPDDGTHCPPAAQANPAGQSGDVAQARPQRPAPAASGRHAAPSPHWPSVAQGWHSVVLSSTGAQMYWRSEELDTALHVKPSGQVSRHTTVQMLPVDDGTHQPDVQSPGSSHGHWKPPGQAATSGSASTGGTPSGVSTNEP